MPVVRQYYVLIDKLQGMNDKEMCSLSKRCDEHQASESASLNDFRCFLETGTEKSIWSTIN
jgi:hypothetical protein